jgi:hypothetical protein
MKTSKYLAISAIAALIVGCGGGGGSTDINNSGNNNGTSSSNTTPTGTAYYKDSGVVGVNYKCGSQSGVTKEEGKFTFEKGADCEFSLADIPLRKIPKSELADNKVIVETDVNVAQLLQSLDVDGNPDNGIQITKEVIEAVKETVAELKIKDPKKIIEDNTTKAIFVSEVAQQAPEAKVELKPMDEVIKHLEKTKTEVTKALLAGKTFWVVGAKDDDGNYEPPMKIVINKDVTSMTVESKKQKVIKIEIKGDRLYFPESENEAERIIGGVVIQKDGYILVEDGDGEWHKLFTSEAEAKKYYETLKKETTITEDKIKKAFVGKTLYKAFKCGNEVKYDKISVSGNTINLVTSNSDTDQFNYTLSGNILITKDKETGETERTKIVKIVPNQYIVTLDEKGNQEIWAYSKEVAAQHISSLGHSTCEMPQNNPNTPNNSLASYIVGKTYYVTVDGDNGEFPHVEKLEFKNEGKTLVVSWMEDGELHQHTFTYNIEGNKITLKGDDFTETFYGPIHETKDYIKFGTHDGAFYKTKEAAEAALNKNSNSLENTNSNLTELLAGKTFYGVIIDEKKGYKLKKFSFNNDLTSVSVTTLEGKESDSGSYLIKVKENKIFVEDTPNKYFTFSQSTNEYVVMKQYINNQPSGEAKLFFDETKAREYYNSLQN